MSGLTGLSLPQNNEQLKGRKTTFLKFFSSLHEPLLPLTSLELLSRLQTKHDAIKCEISQLEYDAQTPPPAYDDEPPVTYPTMEQFDELVADDNTNMDPQEGSNFSDTLHSTAALLKNYQNNPIKESESHSPQSVSDPMIKLRVPSLGDSPPPVPPEA